MDMALYLATGTIAGLLAGLLGVGGGLVIVPILMFIFSGAHFPAQHVLHLALGTSLATIIATSISSAHAHHAHAAVNWDAVLRIAPGIAFGCLLGAWLAARLDTAPLKLLLVGFEFYVGTQILLNIHPHPGRALPGITGMTSVGMTIGILSTLVGIGGGTLSVPFMVFCNRSMREAVGTASAIGLPIALFGSIGFMWSGWNVAGLPPYSLGFVYLPALAGIALASILTAPLGAWAAHRLPAGALKKMFALLLYGLGIKMVLTL